VVSLDGVALLSDDRMEELLSIHAALDNLTALDPRKGKVFEMRYFGGMSLEGVADTLSVSTVTVERDWRMAKIWLRREMAPGAQNAT